MRYRIRIPTLYLKLIFFVILMASTQNIFQVLKESDIDDILANHMKSLVVIMLSSQDCPPCKIIKPKFISLSKEHSDVFFIYVDRTRYHVGSNKYFVKYVYTPTFVFYFGDKQIAFLEGAQEESLVRTLVVLKDKINAKRHEMIERDRQLNEVVVGNVLDTNDGAINADENMVLAPIDNSTELVRKKIAILNQLRELTQNGAILTRGYNLNSEYDDMVLELQLQTNPQFKKFLASQQHSIAPTMGHKNDHIAEKDDVLERQEKIRKIQELDLLHQKMQQQSLQKIEQLKKIQQLKERHEKGHVTSLSE